MLSYTIREERRRTNETCVWCAEDSQQVETGTILNESSSGVLLESETLPELKKRIWILSLPGENTAELEFTPDDIRQHPLTRQGITVRQDAGNRIGIQFEAETQERPVYQRWFRNNNVVVTFIHREQAAITLTGALSIETAALLQKIFTQQGKNCRGILFSVHDVNQINGPAMTVLRTALQQCDRAGIELTILTGRETSAIFTKSLTLENGFLFNVHELSSPQSNEGPRDVTPESIPLNTTYTDAVVIVTRGSATLNRLGNQLERLGVMTWKTQNFKEVPDLIATNNPRFLVIDIEQEHCPQLVLLNKIRNYKLNRFPPALVIGPPHLGELIKEALALPVKVYLTKPCTDREYVQGLQGMLSEDYDVKIAKKGAY